MIFQSLPLILKIRVNHFVNGAVAAEQTKKKPFFDIWGKPFVFKQVCDIKEIPRMLPVERRANLAAVELLERYNPNRAKGFKFFLRLRAKRHLYRIA